MPCTLWRGAISESESLKRCLWDEKPLDSRCPDSSRCNNQGCTSPVVIFAHLPYFCYWTQVQLFTAPKPIIQEATVSRKGWVLIRKSTNLGRRWTHVLRLTWKILLSHERILKGEMGNYLSDSLRHEVVFSMNLSSDVILPVWSACRVDNRALESREPVIL